MHEPPSTASSLFRKLAGTGKSASDIVANDISDVYSTFNIGRDTVDTRRSDQEMAALAATDTTEAPIGLIVETRAHPNLEPVVRQVLDLGIVVQIVHGTDNADFVATTFAPEIAAGQIRTTPIAYQSLGRDDYNGLLMSRVFWDALYGRGKILVFQTDAILCPQSAYDLRDFLEFDYIGSAWGRARNRGIVVDGGNGGLSLRDWHRSVECLERFPPNIWWSGGEDSYFCFHIDLIGGRVAHPKDAARFGSQFWFRQNSFGAHKIEQMRFIERVLFLAWCPEGRALLDRGSSAPEYLLGRVLKTLQLSGLATRLYRRLRHRPQHIISAV